MCIQFSKSVKGYTSAWGNNPLTYLELEVQMTPYFQKKISKKFFVLENCPYNEKSLLRLRNRLLVAFFIFVKYNKEKQMEV
jgi:hypothetical protein